MRLGGFRMRHSRGETENRKTKSENRQEKTASRLAGSKNENRKTVGKERRAVLFVVQSGGEV
jgi:hypothetical protein